MNAGKVIGRVVATAKDKAVVGKKILLLEPMSWQEVNDAINNKGKKKTTGSKNKSIIALDAVGAGASEYVFYVSSKEACQAFDDEPVCHNAIIGIIDGMTLKE